MTRWPVMCAVNSPLRPRKPMMSVAPAIKLRTNGSARIPGSAPANAVLIHLFRVDDFIKALLVDVAGLERGLLQGQPLVIRHVGDRAPGLTMQHLRHRVYYEKTGRHALWRIS